MLAICHSIIQKHNGTITVQSKAGVGTSFAIYLPASNQPVLLEEDSKMELMQSKQQATILVMEDESMIREMIKPMLENFGYKVILAVDGEEAIEHYNTYNAEGKTIDLAIMDLTIPGGMGGKETIVEILAIHPNAKAIVASGYSNDPVMANCEQYGFVASISKPYRKVDLYQLIHSVLAQL